MSTTYPDLNTSFPDSTQDFPEMLDISESDAPLIIQYQQYMQQGDFENANRVLGMIPEVEKKILTNDFINLVGDTTVALERTFAQRYRRGYIVSETQPDNIESGDLWFKVIKNG